MPSTFGSVVRNNLIVVVGSAVLLGLVAKFFDESAVALFMYLYLGQVLLNLILALMHLNPKPEEVGAAPYFLSMLLVLIIGFGACSSLFSLA